MTLALREDLEVVNQILDIGGAQTIPAPSRPKQRRRGSARALPGASAARLRRLVDAPALLVKPLQKKRPPFRGTWQGGEPVTHPGASQSPIRAVGRDRDTGR